MKKKLIIIAALLLIAAPVYALSPAFLGLMGGCKTTGIATVSISNGGADYETGGVLTLAEGTGGTCTITANNGADSYCEDAECFNENECETGCLSTWHVTGAVTGIQLTTPGLDYEVSVKATSGGTGTGATISIDAVCP